MCETHGVEDKSWIRRALLTIYGKWIENTLEFYLFMGKMTELPLVGPAVRFFAGHYGRYYHGGRAATVEECMRVIDAASGISLMDCACRVLNRKCDSPLMACITVNTGAATFSRLKGGKYISKGEAGAIVSDSYKKGLIRVIHHCIAPDTYAICNCCTCCCVPYRLRSVYGIKSAVGLGRMVAEIKTLSCTGCGNCTAVCPQSALDPRRGRVLAENCLGCGLCTASCTAGAIQMVNRESDGHSLNPGGPEKFLMYIIFAAVILPLAFIFKYFNPYTKAKQ